MGRVWVARQTGQRGLRKLVAVKTALAEYARNPEFERLFMDEARVACALEHPNACRVLEVGDEDGVLFLAMEWLMGGSLRELLSAAPAHRLDPRIAARMISQACAGVHAAHELHDESGTFLGVIHRDVSPHNLLLTVDGHTKIADFGVVRASNQLHEKTNTGDLKGKTSYMAPEQLAGRGYDRRADIFALGCVLYEAIVGAKAFEGEAISALYRIIEGRFVRPSHVLGSCDAELERIILRAMAREPEERFATADEMRLALERWLASTGEPCTESDVASTVKTILGDVIERRDAKIRAAEAAVATRAPNRDSASAPVFDMKAVNPTSAGPQPISTVVTRSSRSPWRSENRAIVAAAILAVTAGVATSLLRRAPRTVAAAPTTEALSATAPSPATAISSAVATTPTAVTTDTLEPSRSNPRQSARPTAPSAVALSAPSPVVRAPAPAPEASKSPASGVVASRSAAPVPVATGRPHRTIDSTDPFEE
jgi:serine/threonine-protein kinase